MPARAAMIGGTLAAWLACAGAAPAQERFAPPEGGDFPVSAPPRPPAEPGWPRTAFQRPPDLPPIPTPRPPADPFREPPISPYLPQTPAPAGAVVVPNAGRVTLPAGPRQRIDFTPRYERPGTVLKDLIDADTERATYLGGVIFNVTTTGADGVREVELATDTAVAWITGGGGRAKEIELYLTGNVVIRTRQNGGVNAKPVEQVLRASEIYYDVGRNKAIALRADLEMSGDALPDAVHLRSPEIWRLGQNEWRAFDALTYSSKRPADPNLTVRTRESALTFVRGPRRNVFGLPYRDLATGEVEEGYERTLASRDATVRVLGVPIFYTPRSKADLSEPFGPLVGVSVGNDDIFGTQLYTTFDIHKILAVRPPNGHRWLLNADYLSKRGPGVGTNYYYTDPSFFGLGGVQTGMVKAYGVRDEGPDLLGGNRGPQPILAGDYADWVREAANRGLTPPLPPEANDFWRGRFLFRHNQELYEEGVSWLRVQAQVAYLSDKNFLEQYYKQEFDMGPNQETFAYLHGARGNAWAQGWFEANNERRWVTETEWLPRVDGALLGQSFLGDRFVYSARATAGHANFLPTEVPPLAVLPTDQQRLDGLGRFDLNQRLSAPFDLGPIRLEPYAVLDTAYYSQTLEQRPVGYEAYDGLGGVRGLPGSGFETDRAEGRGRFYGGGGLSASTTFSRIYSEAASELFNVRGLNHKVTPAVNYFASYSDLPYNRLPQLDRVFNDTTDQSYRNFRPFQGDIIRDSNRKTGPNGLALQESPAFDPQQLAIRRLVEGRPDTLDSMQVVQAELRQRLQTKRGFRGAEHTVDWMALDLSASYYPDPQRDNYGQSWAFLEYAYLWHLGDRFSLFTNGWYEPLEFGARYYNVGVNISRPDGTNFTLSYRHTDPINSRLATAGVNYALNRKYTLNFNTSYDFGTEESLVNTIGVARAGTDMTVLIGLTYNAILNNFGFQFSLAPNAVGNGSGRLFGLNPGSTGMGR